MLSCSNHHFYCKQQACYRACIEQYYVTEREREREKEREKETFHLTTLSIANITESMEAERNMSMEHGALVE